MSFSYQKKEIIYRDGLVRFHIPKNWNEEYEESGGGMFYETGEDTGTLRLNILSFLMKEVTSPNQLLEMVKKRKAENNGQVEVLSNERFLLKYTIKGMENGEDLLIFYWEVAKMVSPKDYNRGHRLHGNAFVYESINPGFRASFLRPFKPN
jgi:hypothetical protein